MNQIEQIKAEVGVFQDELDKLKKRHTELSQNFSPPISGSTPGELFQTIEAATNAAADRRRKMEVIREAIALLEPQLQQKQAELFELQKQQQRDEMELDRAELQPQLLELAHHINGLSSQIDAACTQYRKLATQYNQTSSKIEGQQTSPINMNVSGLPVATTIASKKFNLKLGMRKLRAEVAFEQHLEPYRGQSFSYEPSIETRLELQRELLNKMQQFCSQVPAWDTGRIAMYTGQISEAERKIKLLSQQQEAT